MRATAVILIIDTINHVATWGHIGDFRLCCFRNGRVNSLIRDHSMSQNMVDAGYLKPMELRSSPTRNQFTQLWAMEILLKWYFPERFSSEARRCPVNGTDTNDVFIFTWRTRS
ncbi:hypothetical protein [Nitrosomonas sp. PY1]|uniref:hypothetical protein n=1 Tax=Nitrosomonas sp. PY1 TaxID=1803906 RepID=UPI001FC8B306|nr:hypothetical protein [Nitrosomonas sp. PY1]